MSRKWPLSNLGRTYTTISYFRVWTTVTLYVTYPWNTYEERIRPKIYKESLIIDWPLATSSTNTRLYSFAIDCRIQFLSIYGDYYRPIHSPVSKRTYPCPPCGAKRLPQKLPRPETQYRHHLIIMVSVSADQVAILHISSRDKATDIKTETV